MALSAERLAGVGLAFAALTIVALALLVRFELDREGELHREVIAGLAVKDSLEALRIQLNDLRSAARFAAAGAPAQALQTIERRAVEIDAELEYLAQQPIRREAGDAFEALTQASRLLAVNARSISSHGPGDMARLGETAARAAELERLGTQASSSLERTLHVQRQRINDITVARIEVGDTLRNYVSWLLAGSITVLVGLFGFYRWAKGREVLALRRIEHLAHFDTVTGLPNRALLTDRLEQEVARAQRSSQGFALLLFDLDGFKGVNDTWGHAAGDQVLVLVGERARACMRASDTVGRQGGDEFLAILPQATVEGALAVAEKLRASLQQPYVAPGFNAILSASFGAAFFPGDGLDAEALHRAADGALYEAKGAGRNQVRVALPASTDLPEATPVASVAPRCTP